MLILIAGGVESVIVCDEITTLDVTSSYCSERFWNKSNEFKNNFF